MCSGSNGIKDKEGHAPSWGLKITPCDPVQGRVNMCHVNRYLANLSEKEPKKGAKRIIAGYVAYLAHVKEKGPFQC